MTHIITLVHGTFARHPAWTRRNSIFRNSVSAGLGDSVRFVRFRWSGENSDRARLAASQRLEAFIKRLQLRYRDAAHSVIAHSHGGNVLIYATARNSDIAERLHGICFIGTPFVRAEPRSIPSYFNLLGLAVCLAISLVVGTAVSVLLLTSYGVKAADFFTPYVIGVSFIILGSGWRGRWRQRVLTFVEERQQALQTRLSTWPLPLAPMLIAHVATDEARRYLRFLRELGELPFRIHRVLQMPFSVLLIVAFLLAQLRLPGAPFVVAVLAGAIICSQLGMMLFAKLVRGHRLAFGDGLLDNWLANISVDTTPIPLIHQYAADAALVDVLASELTHFDSSPELSESIGTLSTRGEPVTVDSLKSEISRRLQPRITQLLTNLVRSFAVTTLPVTLAHGLRPFELAHCHLCEDPATATKIGEWLRDADVKRRPIQTESATR